MAAGAVPAGGVPPGARPLVCGIGDEAAAGLADQVRIHAELGMRGIELRTVDGRGAHEWTAGQARLIAETVAGRGLAVPVLDTPIGGWAVTVAGDFDAELRILRRSAAHAALLGCHRLRVMSYPNDGRPESRWRAESVRRMRELQARAQDLGVTLLHENCQGWAGQGAAQTLDLLASVDGLRLIFDTGNGLAYGYDPLEFLRAVLPHIDHVHVKDGVRRPGGEVSFGLPGEGEVDLAGCLRLLTEAGYRGWYSLEPHVAHIPHLGVSAEAGRLEHGYRACAQRFIALLGAAAVPAGSRAGSDRGSDRRSDRRSDRGSDRGSDRRHA